MSAESLVLIALVLLLIILFSFFVFKKYPKRLKKIHYTRKWRELQKLCGDKNSWPEALKSADKLLEEALKKRKKGGKTVGEMMVSAETDFSDKEAIWKAHKLVARINDKDPSPNLNESDVKNTLVAYRQALRDLGAL